jgi:hypothetical protein
VADNRNRFAFVEEALRERDGRVAGAQEVGLATPPGSTSAV